MTSDTAVAPVGATDLRAIKRRFLAVNAARLDRTRQILRPRQRGFLDLLPLLFHINDRDLPGFVSADAPSGIPDYRPDAAAVEAARQIARRFQLQRQLAHRYAILAIYVMGSPGTVAFSEGSDFDIWLCHEPSLNAAQLALLQNKATAIEKWAESLGLEVHFFLVNAREFRGGQQQTVSEESSGSAQHSLLLEEFYRTGLLLAGRYPLWWLVPPEQENEYDAYTARLREHHLDFEDYIDFGGLAHIPAEEFFGAALWQLYKGIDSPYKSVLKLALIESYASEYPHIGLLSLRFKQEIYGGERDIDRLDPYLMMLSKVETYFSSRGEKERLELARRCLYFKLNKRLSSSAALKNDPNAERISQLVRDWGWTQADLLVMDSRDMWKVHRVTDERRALFDALSASYRFLSDFARNHAGLALISQHDLNVLGRKLYAAYERKAGKVELLNRGISGDLTESHLSLHHVCAEEHSSWLLYSGQVRPDSRAQAVPLKRSRSLVELLAWCHFNGLLQLQRTIVSIFPKSALSVRDFRALAERMVESFPPDRLPQPATQDFSRPAQALRTVLFVTTGKQPGTRLGALSGNLGDPLCYGGERQNLVADVEQVLLTSWGEVLTFRHAGDKAIMECLCEYLKWGPPHSRERPIPPVYGYDSPFAHKVAERVQQLFKDVVHAFYDGSVAPGTRYIVEIGRNYYALSLEGDSPRYELLEDHAALLRYLAGTHSDFRNTLIDRYALSETVLPLIFRQNRPGVVQFFFRPLGKEVEVYVLDERGALFFQKMAFYDANALLSQYARFFEAVLNRVDFQMQDGQDVSGAQAVEFFAIVREPGGRFQLEARRPRNEPSKHYLSLQVLVDAEEGRTVFTVYCADREFSTLEHGRDIFKAVVRHVLDLRRSGQHYPIYITDISMSHSVLGVEQAGRVQTIHFLNYKRRIEHELNRALRQVP